jgi:hypothetical protein
MTTGTTGNNAVVHQLHTAVIRRRSIAFNTANIGTGLSMGYVPAGAIITAVTVLIETVFNAGTTNVLVVGTSGNDDAYLAAGDVDETALGLTRYSGKAAKLASDTEVFVKYTQSGTAATTGAATVLVEYVLDNDN